MKVKLINLCHLFYNFITFHLISGDPLAYHAKYIINCRDLDQQIMVSRSRVSSITNKKMVVAKDDGDSIKYLIYSLDDLSAHAFSKKLIKFFIQWIKTF